MYPDKWDVIHVHNKDVYDRAVAHLTRAAERFGALAVDTETTGLEAKSAELVLLQLATPDIAYVFETKNIGPEVKSLLNNGSITKIAHNMPFDWSFIRHHLDCWIGGWDTRKVASRLSGEIRSLKTCAGHYLDVTLPKTLATQFVDQEIVLTPNGIMYAGIDALVLWPLVLHFLTYGTQRLTQDDFILTNDELQPMADYVLANGPWPGRTKYENDISTFPRMGGPYVNAHPSVSGPREVKP